MEMLNAQCIKNTPSVEHMRVLRYCTVGWSDFGEKKNAIHSMSCQIVVGPQIQNVMS